jgi:tetratricopeptide (TPR) repeat protein
LSAAHALQELEAAEALVPADAGLHRALAGAYHAAGREIEAKAQTCAADALDAGAPLALFNLGTAFLMVGQNDAAAKWYNLALRLDPDLTVAHQNLASVLDLQGDVKAARSHRDLAYRRQCVFVEPAAAPKRRVLILSASGRGNVPIKWLLPSDVNTHIKWFVEYANLRTQNDLPEHDLVFNAIGDPDMEKPGRAAVRRFLRTCTKPLLNAPDRVARTRRDRLAGLLAGIRGIEVPCVARVRCLRDAETAIDKAGLGFPLLVRPVGSHGGDGLGRLDTQAALHEFAFDRAPSWYLSAFRNYQSQDGYWRKYRVIFVDRKPYPYHLAISRRWLVHYVTANMLSDAAKTQEESRFLQNPIATLGVTAMDSLRAIGDRLDLDYAGIDFACLPDGRLLVFEANATMLVHPETLAILDYKNPFVRAIRDAFGALLDRTIIKEKAVLF